MLDVHIVDIAESVVVFHGQEVTSRELMLMALGLVGDRDRLVSCLDPYPHTSNYLARLLSEKNHLPPRGHLDLFRVVHSRPFLVDIEVDEVCNGLTADFMY